MIEKGLAYYLKYPERMKEVSDKEIDSLLSKYPYAQSLHWLKARKELDSDTPGKTASIRKAAAYSDDLIFLRYQLLRDQEEMENIAVQLKEEENAPAQEPSTKKKDKEPRTAAREDAPISKSKKKTPKKDVNQAAEAKKKKEKKTSQPKSEEIKSQVRKKTSKEEKQETVDRTIREFEAELSDFSKWLMAQGVVDAASKADKEKDKKVRSKKKKKSKKKEEKKSSKKNKLQKLIDHSIIEHEDLVTETYAQLVADQGHTAEAIKLYEKLQLKMPEKSSYFAGKIEELKNS